MKKNVLYRVGTQDGYEVRCVHVEEYIKKWVRGYTLTY